MTLHTAPPVVFPLGRSTTQGVLLAFVWGLAALATAAWLASVNRLDGRVLVTGAVAVSVLGLSAATAWRAWSRSFVGQLAWNGAVWQVQSAAYQSGLTEQTVSVCFDGQRALLLRLENPARARLWVWVERRSMPDRWLDLRRAVYGPPAPDAFGRASMQEMAPP